MVQIFITPGKLTSRGQEYSAKLRDGTFVCTSREPFYNSARVLLSWGYDPREPLEALRAGTTQVDFRDQLGKASAKTVVEGETVPPRITQYREHPDYASLRPRTKEAAE